MKEYCLQGNIVLPNRIEFGQIKIKNKKIIDVIFNKNQFNPNPVIISEDKFICPGFIELQINGAFGKEFKTDVDALNTVSDNLYKFGTTSFCPTITTKEIGSYNNHLKLLYTNFKYSGGTKFIGFHLEGPSLNPKKVGAQNASFITNPSDIDIDAYLNENIKLVTLAPELDGSKEFIEILLKRGIKVGIGHSLIEYDDLKNIFDSENMWIIHLFNAMEPLKSRDPGLVGFGLNEDCFTGAIIDKVHLHPKTVDIICKLKLDKLISVSDGSAVTGLDSGEYKIGDRIMLKTDKKVTLPNGTLVGSVLTQNIAVKNIVEINNCKLYEAIKTVSYNPAKLLGIQHEIGQISVGNYADLTILEEDFTIFRTIINGTIMYEKQ